MVEFAALFRRLIPLGYRIIARARLDLVVLLGVNFHPAEGPVQSRVGGGIAYVVLAAQFLGNLVEGILQFVQLVSHFDDAAAGFTCELFHFAVARISAEAVKAAVRNQQHIADRIGLLGGFNGRIVGWSVLGVLVGFGVGSASGSNARRRNGVIGGLVGGALGGIDHGGESQQRRLHLRAIDPRRSAEESAQHDGDWRC